MSYQWKQENLGYIFCFSEDFFYSSAPNFFLTHALLSYRVKSYPPKNVASHYQKKLALNDLSLWHQRLSLD